MNINQILDFIEDKDFMINEEWYFHATSNNIDVIKKILEEGIKSAYLRDAKPNHFNGKYYISLYKQNTLNPELNLWLDKYPKFVIDDIEPLYADRGKLSLRRFLINTRIPLRTSEWDGEYQQYLMIDTSKFVALGYDFAYMLNDAYCSNEIIIEKLQLLKEIVQYMNQMDNHLPIYDFSTQREINRSKVLSLHI